METQQAGTDDCSTRTPSLPHHGAILTIWVGASRWPG